MDINMISRSEEIYSRYDELPSGEASHELTDGCLVLEGGAWRGMYTQGVIDALMEHGINFQTVIGISAGAMSGIGYVSGQIGWAAHINLKYRHNPNYCGTGAMRRDHGITGFSFLFQDLFEEYPINAERFEDPNRRFVVAATNMLRGRVEYFEKGKCTDIFKAVQASATVPYVSEPVMIDDIPYLDGGMITKIPYHWAKSRDFKKIMVVKSRERSYRKEERDLTKPNHLFYHNYPNLEIAIQGTTARYNRLMDEIDADERAGDIFVQATDTPIDVSRFEGDMEKLGDLYFRGYEEMNARIPELKAYLNS